MSSSSSRRSMIHWAVPWSRARRIRRGGLAAIEALSRAGVQTGSLVAPVIPGMMKTRTQGEARRGTLPWPTLPGACRWPHACHALP
jgi:hypothetical protein